MNSIDIFCNVIDNYGDIGVVYRLSKEFRAYYGSHCKIRVFFNKPESFKDISSDFNIDKKINIINGTTFINYLNDKDECFDTEYTAELIIEAFGCEIPDIYLKKAHMESKILLNLEYLSFEEWTKDFHLRESPIGFGKMKKFFYMPGIFNDTGGIILDKEFLEKIKEKNRIREKVLGKYFKNIEEKTLFISIFSYECNFENLLYALQECDCSIKIMVCGEKSVTSLKEILKKTKTNTRIEIVLSQMVSQEEYDEVVIASDVCFVRGEESFVRALISGNVVIWHSYLQENMDHMEKVKAYLDFAKKYFEDKKIFEKYYNLVYNYNRREYDSFKNIFPAESMFLFESMSELKNTFGKISEYIIEECNLVLKMNNFLQNNL